MATGRNKPCPCGSGKKYKKCCLIKSREGDGLLFRHRRIGQVRDKIAGDLLGYVKSEYGQEPMLDAWDIFINDPTKHLELDDPQIPLFLSWFCYHWQPEGYGLEDDSTPWQKGIPAQNYLDRYSRRLPDVEGDSIREGLLEPSTFWEVMECTQGESYLLRDVLLDREFFVLEKLGSSKTKKHDILFGKLVTVEGISMLDGVGHYIIKPVYKLDILNARELLEGDGMAMTRKNLLKYQMDLIHVFHTIAHQMENPLTRVQNTDGEKFGFHKVVFAIESAQDAFDALKGLANEENGLLQNVKRNKDGTISEVRFNWVGQGNKMVAGFTTTNLGTVDINGSQLTVQVNSAARAERIKQIIQDKLPNAKYRATMIESVEAKIKAAKKNRPDMASLAEEKRKELQKDPAVVAKMNEIIRAQYAAWPDTKLPALNGMTPRQAARTESGKEKVEVLLVHLKQIREDGAPVPEGTIRKIREELALDE